MPLGGKMCRLLMRRSRWTSARRVITRRSDVVARVCVLLCVLSLHCDIAAAFLRRCWLRQQPCGCLRRPRRDRGIASSPYSLLGFSGTPLYRRRSAVGLEAAGRRGLTRRSAAGARGGCAALRSAVALRLLRRILAPLLPEGATAWQPPAAKEGQGDCDFPLGPPWILLYPLKRRRSAMGLEAAKRRVLTRRSAAGARG